MDSISYISINNIDKIYTDNKAVIKDFNIEINKGEFIVIVGPSGSGKSTLLEIICGFENPSSGTIKIDNKIVNDVLPKDRDVSMVFQDYALFPHMTVYENIAFGMKIRKEDKKSIDKKVKWAAKILKLDNYLEKKPKKLSGGQRQRVALARAMVRNPKLFLMDEPLSNLDSQLRYSTCREIRKLHNEISATTIYVTHDQVEALSMADRIIVLNEGIIQQIGTPYEIYENPSNIFVAKFIGQPHMNLLDMRFEDDYILLDDIIKLPNKQLDINNKKNKYILGLRPENIIFCKEEENGIQAVIKQIEYSGGESLIYLEIKGIKLIMKYSNSKEIKVGDILNISFNLDKASIFDCITKNNIKET